jgi:hypothetical protein
MALLGTSHALAQTVTIGSTSFPKGELAFPVEATCIAADGCGGGVFLLDSNLQPVARVRALVGHDLGLVAVDLDSSDEIRLRFDSPIQNDAGAELYLAQSEFLTALADPAGPGTNDVQIRPEGVADWCTVSATRFAHDPAAGTPTVFYSDPEIKSDAYRLWFCVVDLSECGVAAGQAILQLDVRGGPGSGSKIDLAVVGNVNPDPDPDADGINDPSDNCPVFPNASQLDTDADGRGDECECGDQDGDGSNTVLDLVAINWVIFNPALVTPLCDANGDEQCDVSDIIAANTEIFSPGSTSTCARQPIPGP